MHAPAISNSDLDFEHTKLKCKLVQDIVIINICEMFYQNQFTFKGARQINYWLKLPPGSVRGVVGEMLGVELSTIPYRRLISTTKSLRNNTS